MTSVLDEVRPGTGQAAELAERDRRAVARPVERIPLVVSGGHGATLVDADGREVLDLTSGWNVANTGWGHPHVVEAVRRQAGAPFAPPWCSHAGRVEIAERLSALLGGGDWAALCGCGGSEAVEAALKVARRATGRQAVVAFREAYHGGTLGAMLAGGVPQLHGVDVPEDPALHRHAPIPDLLRSTPEEVLAGARETIASGPPPAAVLLEPVFTNPGVLFGDQAFYTGVAEAARAAGALLILDEVGTGFGRCGTMFGFQGWGLEPDLVCVAKGLTSGAVPMAGALMRSDLAEAVAGPGFSSTFGWTPLACAAAHATLDVLEKEQLPARAERLGRVALDRLRPLVDRCAHVGDVRARGLELGVELVAPDGSPLDKTLLPLLTRSLLDRGVFCEPSAYTSTLLLMPPLVIDESELLGGLDAVADEIEALEVPA